MRRGLRTCRLSAQPETETNDGCKNASEKDWTRRRNSEGDAVICPQMRARVQFGEVAEGILSRHEDAGELDGCIWPRIVDVNEVVAADAFQLDCEQVCGSQGERGSDQVEWRIDIDRKGCDDLHASASDGTLQSRHGYWGASRFKRAEGGDAGGIDVGFDACGSVHDVRDSHPLNRTKGGSRLRE